MSRRKELQRPEEGPPRIPPTPPRPATPLDDPLGGNLPIHEYVDALRRHAWLVGAAVIVALAVTVYRAGKEPPRYHASSSVRLIDQRPAITGGLAETWNERTMGGWTDPIRTQMEVLKSRAVIEEVVAESGYRLHSLTPGLKMEQLRDVYVAATDRIDTLAVVFGSDSIRVTGSAPAVSVPYGAPIAFGDTRFTVRERPPVDEAQLVTVPERGAIEEVTGGLIVKPRDMTTIIDIGFYGPDPTVAMRVVNAAALVFERTSTTTTQQQSARRREFITGQLRITDSILRSNEDRLIYLQQQQGGRRLPDPAEGDPNLLANARRQRAALQAELELYQRLIQGADTDEGLQLAFGMLTSPELRQNPALAELASELLRYSIQRDSLVRGTVARTAAHPEVQRIDTLLGSTRQQFAAAVRGHESLIRDKLEVLDRELASGIISLTQEPSDQIEEARLTREVETIRNLSDKLREELQAAQISEAVEVGEVQVVDLAPFGTGPLGRGRNRKLLFGALVGLMFGSFAAIAVDRFNTTIRHREEIERVLRLPELSVIPQLSPIEAQPRPRLLARVRRDRSAPVLPVLNGGIAPLGSISSYGAESYRKLMANLIFTPNAASLTSLVITSPLASEGKTTTAVHLAIAFAEHGRRVLLVDADLRRGRLHQIFNTERQPGLSEVIIGDVAIGDALRPTSNPNLMLLSTGASPSNPLEFLGSPRMSAFLEAAAERFDLVIIDTAPVLLAADAVALAVKAAGVLLVIRAGSTQRASARHAKHQLDAVGARVLGAVLNDADSKLGGYVKYSAYYSSDEVTEVVAG